MDRSTWAERVMEELIQGREMTCHLRDVIGSSDDVTLAEGLVTKIMGSLTNTLVMLNETHYVSNYEEELISHVGANETTAAIVTSGSSSPDVVRVDEAVKSPEESGKRVETLTDRRGFHKIRKNSYSWTKETLDLVNDGHAWRKYGQKTIHNTKHPRKYFRCTYKFDQGCKATKHVQMIKDEPQLYRTTYYGNHTCTDYLKAQEFVLDCSSQEDPSQKNMIQFNSIDSSTSKQERPFSKSFKPFSDQDHSTHENQTTRMSSGSLMSLVQGVLEPPSEPFNDFSSEMAYDHEVDLFCSMMVEYFDDELEFLYKL